MKTAPTGTPLARRHPLLPNLVNSTGLAGGVVVGDGTWLTIGEVLAKLRAEGFTDSESTVRRDIDDGIYGVEGKGWHRTGRGHRRVRATAVDKLIADRNRPEES